MRGGAVTVLHAVGRVGLWALRRLLIAAWLVVVAAALVWLPTLWTIRADEAGVELHFAFGPYWQNFTRYLGLLLRGGLRELPMYQFGLSTAYGNFPELLARILPTVSLFGAALLVALAGGCLAGLQLSRFGAGRGGRGAGMLVNVVLLFLPDMVLTIALIELAIVASRRLGLSWHGSYDVHLGWRNYLLPTVALALVPAAHVARITAAALDAQRSELYMRTALAKGCSGGRLRRHAWRNAFLQVWAALPAIVGVLLSSQVIVEYLTGVPGVGREIGYALRPPNGQEIVSSLRNPLDASGANLTRLASLCIVMLLLYVVIDTLQDGGYRLLDPRPVRGTARESSARTRLRELPAAIAARARAALPAALATPAATATALPAPSAPTCPWRWVAPSCSPSSAWASLPRCWRPARPTSATS